MTKASRARLERTLVNTDNKVVRVLPPAQKEVRKIEYNGIEMMVVCAPGQIINPRKEYLRRKKALGK